MIQKKKDNISFILKEAALVLKFMEMTLIVLEHIIIFT